MTHSKQMVKLFGLAMAVTAALSLPVAVAAAGGPPENAGTGTGLDASSMGYELDAEEQSILTEFLFDEYKALATYESIMSDFGAIQPFASIARAEEQHIAALERIFSRYDVALPPIPFFDIPSFGSLEEAAKAAVQAEIDNADLYDRLLSGIDNPDVVQVAGNLRDASLYSHLPAFEAAANGSYVAGEGEATMAQQGRSGDMTAAGRHSGFGSAAPGDALGQVAGTSQRGPATRGQAAQAGTLNADCPSYQQGAFRSR
ncbi:MAG: hypothetical protein MUQ30_12650 [Anaerolineae bacterium]|nr:hypothetical protein [Anaerolineae bacterium]